MTPNITQHTMPQPAACTAAAATHRGRATASRIALHRATCRTARDYLALVGDLLDSPEVTALHDYRHHRTTRHQHVLNVSWYSFLLARLTHMDAAAAARAGLLHDLYYYNFCDWQSTKRHHIYHHPQQALDNASRLTDVSPIEADVILNHMWPMSPDRPHYKETYLISCIDKYCCLLELSAGFLSALGRRCRALLHRPVFHKGGQA
ncbi:MAG: hypothetical protein IJB55_07030 [Firmicutes bacterium]|nr:hypothetical protein [Bacillota bacterium]